MTRERQLPHLTGMPRRRQPGSLALSIVIHVLVILALGTITFRYPLGQLLGIPKRAGEQPRERLRYVALPRPDAVGNGASPGAAPAKGKPSVPAPLRAPAAAPTGVAPVKPAAAPSQGAVSGQPGGKGGAPVGSATGIEPAVPDPRVSLTPYPYERAPLTPAVRVDSTVKAAWGAYVDSARIAALREGNIPRVFTGDWTRTDKNGNKWGWDPKAIRLGTISIPNAVLAALPLKWMQGNPTQMSDMRNRAWIQRDIADHAQHAITEEDFKAAVRRIRERKERERRDAKSGDKSPRVISEERDRSAR